MTEPSNFAIPEREQVELKAEADALNQGQEAAESTIVTPPTEVAVAKREPISDRATGQQTQPNAAKPLPLKAKKVPRLRLFYLSMLFPLVPIVAVLLSLAADPSARLIFESARSKDPAAKVDKLNEALTHRPDLETLDLRAYAYYHQKKWDEAGRDLQTMVDKNVGDGRIYRSLAFIKAKTEGMTPEIFALLQKSAQLSAKHCASFPSDFSRDRQNLYGTTEDLLACGDFATAMQVSALPVHDANDKDEQKIFKALALKMTGKDKESLATLQQIEPHFSHGYSHSQTLQAGYYQALLYLERGDFYGVRSSSRDVEYYSVTRHDGWMRHWILAWLSFDQADYKKASNNATWLIKQFENNPSSIRDLQVLSSAYLLRAKVEEKVGNKKASAEAMKQYRNLKMSGRFFVPKQHQDWVRKDLAY